MTRRFDWRFCLLWLSLWIFPTAEAVKYVGWVKHGRIGRWQDYFPG
jgi:hypothetical protein